LSIRKSIWFERAACKKLNIDEVLVWLLV